MESWSCSPSPTNSVGPTDSIAAQQPGFSQVPGVAPKVAPVSNGESISTAAASARKGLRSINFGVFPLYTKSGQLSAPRSGYPLTYSHPIYKLPK